MRIAQWTACSLFLIGSVLTLMAAEKEVVASGTFLKKKKSLSGSYSISRENDRLVLVLGDDFKAKSGPDLKIVFSHQTFGQTTGKNALDGHHLIVAPLKAIKGKQSYVLPQSLQLDQYQSLLIHCEKYAVLWGGAAL